MRPRTLVGSAFVVAAAGLAAAAGPATVTAVVCTGVKDRAPVGPGETFPATAGQLYCFTEVVGGSGTVAHVWFHGDTTLGTVELPVKAARWRTWSAKRIPPSMTGAWRVEVRDAAGAVLATAKFTVE